MNRFLFFLSLAALFFGCAPKDPVLTVEGGRIQGVATGTPGVTVYKGIPYAAAPVGELRWKAPQPVVPWDGVKVCDTFGAPSLQSAHTPGGYTPEFFFDGDPAFSEDCLYLNVWTPAAGKPKAKLPVTLWIHGGGYVAGWGSEPEMDGEEWARHGGVLVTFNYRLGILGFLAHPALSAENPESVSGNYGMLDQIAALKWVKANIAAFGGDPERITIMGQSAGAMSVQTLVTSPISKDLVAGAIIQSGGGISERTLLGRARLADAEATGKSVMDWAGYETLEQMRAADPQEFLTLTWRYAAETQQRPVGITSPVIDGYALPESFGDAALGGRIADVPYLIGCTLDDMGGLASGIDRFCIAREALSGANGISSNEHFSCEGDEIPERNEASSSQAYAYQFARRLPTDGRPDVLVGAFHSSELWYTFKSLRFCWRPFTEGDYALSEQMITCWTNFARTGNPNGDGPEIWTPCTAENPQFMVFRLDENDAVASAMGAPLQP